MFTWKRKRTPGRRREIPGYDAEPKMEIGEIAQVAVLMATLPPHINMLEAICVPMKQAYLGRG